MPRPRKGLDEAGQACGGGREPAGAGDDRDLLVAELEQMPGRERAALLVVDRDDESRAG